MIEPIASKLLNEFFAYCLKGPLDRYVYRISPQEVLSNVLKYGTSRKGFFTQEWDRSDLYPEVIKKYGKLQHADIIIASTYEDLLADAKLEQGTFMHKLSIYENPIICVYDKSKLEYLCDEIKNGPQNTGKNWLFLGDSVDALQHIWQIQGLNLGRKTFSLERIK